MAASGLWFVVCVPTEDYERELRSQYQEAESRVLGAGDTVQPGGGGGGDALSKETDSKGWAKDHLHESLSKVLEKTLEDLRIFDALWITDRDKKFYQVCFPCHPGLQCDVVLSSLTANGIGVCKGSSVGVLPCSMLCFDEPDPEETKQDGNGKALENEKRSESEMSTLSKTKSDIKKAFRGFKDMQKKFLKTVTARLTVAQVVEGVRTGALPTFDYVMFVLVASMISALGLLENSSVVIVASMLISPIMGPILAGTFGAVIRDRSLRNLGIMTETLSLFLCLVFGFIFGLICESLNDLWGHREWPTDEMASRGQGRSLWIGVLIALPSGIGVALSVLGGNAGSLVGVAISASLLPPTVNAGLLWGLAVIRHMRAQSEPYEVMEVSGAARLTKKSLAPMPGYEVSYYDEMDKECAMLGLISLVLALVNIVCIFFAAVAVLKIKEVAPKTSVSKTSRFWNEDIKIARDYNKTMPDAEADALGKQFLMEWANLNGLEPTDVMSNDEEARLTRLETLKDIIEDVEADEVFRAVANCVSRPDSQTLSQRLSLDIAEHPHSLQDVEVIECRGERRPSTTVPARRSGLMSWLVPPTITTTAPAEVMHSESNGDNELNSVQLRRPQSQTSETQNRVSVLRQSLMNANNNPYSLWPSQRVSRSRFLVTPAPDVPPPPTRQRISRFLCPNQLVIKETTC